ncbi:lactoylglutathione lyase [Vibrio barjaei]|uniref:lactoylglutathione lyase n=1 Tax=Vibrio barjaei TaxID=1676683 RepID=UPI0022840B7C|nr:lactoylglutathione lyase [Vibrio barjaei]MCY9870754.1 lactoylglutathione lyase [Vibrio barjaei]
MKVLHTMIRVVDLEKSIKFYSEVLGMKMLDRFENEEYRYTLVFVGYEGQDAGSTIELTYNWDTDNYDQGNAWGHIAIGCEDIYAACERIEQLDGNITRAPGPMKGGETHIAFVKDPDGYSIELIQTSK